MLFHTAAVSHYLDLYFTGEVGKLNKPGYLEYLEATFTTSNGSFLITLNIELLVNMDERNIQVNAS